MNTSLPPVKHTGDIRTAAQLAAMTPAQAKVYEVKLRRAANRQGLMLQKHRARDPYHIAYGTYQLVDARTNIIVWARLVQWSRLRPESDRGGRIPLEDELMPKATQFEMRQRLDRLYAIAAAEQPVSCRGVYYRTLGLQPPMLYARKGDQWAHRVSDNLTTMRREGWIPLGGRNTRASLPKGWKRGTRLYLPHPWITEAGRNTIRPNTWGNLGERLQVLAHGFRRTLWTDDDAYVEIWSEAATMLGVLTPVTNELDVYLRPAQGFSSETLSWNAAQDINARGRETFIYQVGDFDPYGFEAWQCVQDRLSELVQVPVTFERVAATVEDRDEYADFTHPVKRPKNEHAGHVARIMKWINEYGDQALEVEAIPSPELRARVREAIMRHISQEQIDAALEQQGSDREELEALAERYADEDYDDDDES